MSDADMENTETQISLDLAKACEHLDHEKYWELRKKSEEIGRMLNHMIENPEKFRSRR